MDENPAEPATFSVTIAHRAQQRMSKLLILEDQLPGRIRHVAGIDVAYTKNMSIAAAAILEYDSLKLEETQTASYKTQLPYIPTLLAFREIKPSIQCIRKLHIQPDIFLVNGHGYAHPYHCGLASHLGLVLQKPTIGIAKNKLIGKIQKPQQKVALITHNGKTIGAKLEINSKHEPIYVSIGHMISLQTAIEITKQTTRNNHLPEPLLEAHQTATTEKRKINIPRQT
jgi:deoxyribonuclease V